MPTTPTDNPTVSCGVDVRAAFRQQLMSDRMFGVDSVPVPPASLVVAPNRTPQTGPSRQDRGAADCAERLRAMDEGEVKKCRKCSLHETRTKTVFGCGTPHARLVFVGEAPGYDEDREGVPFVGKAGRLLTKMIESGMGLARDDVYICNTVKCRPPKNRDPAADEILACHSYLKRQLEWIHPEVIIALGAPAAKTLLHTTQGIGKLRGRFHDYYLSGAMGKGPTVPLMPTYHPAYLLRYPDEKKKSWSDLQMVMEKMGLPLP